MDVRSGSGTHRRGRGALCMALLVATLLASCGERSATGMATPERAASPVVGRSTQAATPAGGFDLPGADPRLASLRTTRVITIAESYGHSFSAYVSGASYTLT